MAGRVAALPAGAGPYGGAWYGARPEVRHVKIETLRDVRDARLGRLTRAAAALAR